MFEGMLFVLMVSVSMIWMWKSVYDLPFLDGCFQGNVERYTEAEWAHPCTSVSVRNGWIPYSQFEDYDAQRIDEFGLGFYVNLLDAAFGLLQEQKMNLKQQGLLATQTRVTMLRYNCSSGFSNIAYLVALAHTRNDFPYSPNCRNCFYKVITITLGFPSNFTFGPLIRMS